MPFSASWMATCIIAYMRASWGVPPRKQAAIVASPAFAFQATTAFGSRRRSRRRRAR